MERKHLIMYWKYELLVIWFFTSVYEDGVGGTGETEQGDIGENN